MSNLQPEKRMDKNGKLVTKHVRVASPTGSKRSLPAPSLQSKSKSKAVKVVSMKDIIEALHKREVELAGGKNVRKVEYGYELPSLEKIPSEVREKLLDYVNKADGRGISKITEMFTRRYEDTNMFACYVNTVGDIKSIAEKNPDEVDRYAVLNDFDRVYSRLKFRERKDPLTEDDFELFRTSYLAENIRVTEHDYVTPHYYYRDFEKIRENYDTIVDALPAIQSVLVAKGYGAANVSECIEIADYVKEHHDRADLIFEAIKERKVFDREIIDDMVSSSPAIASGTL